MFAVTLTLASFLPAAVPPVGPAVDAYGDPLPAGAVARLGSARWRCPDLLDHLIWSPDGKYLVGTHQGKSLTIWAYPAGVVVGRFTVPELLGHPRPKEPELFPPTLTPQQVRFAPDGKSMLVYGGRNQLYRVRVPDGAWERIDTGSHTGTAVAVSADGRRLLMEVPDLRAGPERWSALCVIDLDRQGQAHRLWTRMVSSLGGQPAGFRSQRVLPPQMTPDGQFVLTSAVRGKELQFATLDLRSGRTWLAPPGAYRDACFSPNGDYLFTTGATGRLVRWRLNSRAAGDPTSPVVTPEVQADERVPGDPLAFSPDGRAFADLNYGVHKEPDGTRPHAVTVRDVRTLRTVHNWSFATGGSRPPTADSPKFVKPAVAIGPDNGTIAISVWDSPRVLFFDARTGETRQPGVGHMAAVRTLRATTSGRMLVSVGGEQAGRSWDLGRVWTGRGTHGVGRESTSLGFVKEEDLPSPVRPRVPPKVKVIYDRDRNRLEGRLIESEQIIWEEAVPALDKVAAADRPGSLPDATDRDGLMFAVVIGDAIAVRDPLTGEPLTTFRIPGSQPTAVEFIPDTNLLAAGYDDGQILLWDLWPPDLPRRPPTDVEVARLWADLAGDPRDVLRARMVLLAHPEAAVRGLKEHVRGLAQPTELEIDQWLAHLSHKRYAVREKATRALARHFDVSERPVRDMLAVTKSPEVEQRLKAVLATASRSDGDGVVARLVRVVAVLERIGSPEARDLLFRVARGSGVPAVRAADALARLRDRMPATRTAGKRPMSAIVGKAAKLPPRLPPVGSLQNDAQVLTE